MSNPDPDHTTTGVPAWLMATQWSVVSEAREKSSPRQMEALDKLCRTYRPAVLSYTRRRGFRPEEAEDITQDFFHRLVEKKSLSQVEKGKGRFRSFLLASLRNFLANEWDKRHADKRGNGREAVPLEATNPDGSPGPEPADTDAPDKNWDHEWALTVLQGAWDRLQAEYKERGREKEYAALQPYLTEGQEMPTYAVMANRLETTEGAVKMEIKRMRERYGQLIREVIADSLSSRDQLEDELKHLMQALVE
jgi:RNA polymerase sigma-70 factor (ECF subfamily)